MMGTVAGSTPLLLRATHQRRGVGTRLVRRTEDALSKLGCPKANLQVRAENSEVVAFYEAMGYRAEERTSMGKLL